MGADAIEPIGNKQSNLDASQDSNDMSWSYYYAN